MSLHNFKNIQQICNQKNIKIKLIHTLLTVFTLKLNVKDMGVVDFHAEHIEFPSNKISQLF